MPKITVSGGPTNGVEQAETAVEVVEAALVEDATDEVAVPRGNASQGEWAEFAAANGYEGDPTDVSRDDLRAWWDTRNTTE